MFGQRLLAVVDVDVDFGSDSASAIAGAAAVVVILILVLVIYGTRSLTQYHRMYFFSHGGPRNGHLAPQPVEISKTHHPLHRPCGSFHPNGTHMIYDHPESSHRVMKEEWKNMNILSGEAPAIHSESQIEGMERKHKRCPAKNSRVLPL